MATFKPKSSHILQVDYDPATLSLMVTFHNSSRYLHKAVPQQVYDNFTKYRSAGEFYWGVIRPNYPALKLK